MIHGEELAFWFMNKKKPIKKACPDNYEVSV